MRYRAFYLLYALCISFVFSGMMPKNTNAAEDFKITFPVSCVLQDNCFVSSYFDLNRDIGGVEDYTCGTITKDNQNGTQIILQDFMSSTLPFYALAAADGKVISVSDGIPDLLVATKDLPRYPHNPCGNGILLEHDGGWFTRYCHLKQDSISVSVGQMVEKGQPIARIGTSGQTDWPKLDFSISRNNYLYDPFSGKTSLEGCGGSIDPLWEQDLTYTPFAVLNAGFTIGMPDRNRVEMGKMPQFTDIPDITPDLSFWGLLMNLRKGDIISIEIKDPNGFVFNSYQEEIEYSAERHFVYLYTKKKNLLWDTGTYTGTMKIERYQGAQLHETFVTKSINLYDYNERQKDVQE